MSERDKTRGPVEPNLDEDPQNRKSRRRLLRAAAASGGVAVGLKALPEKWGSPVVDAVVLPAHAQTSDGLSDPCSSAVEPLSLTTWNVRVTGNVVGSGDLSGIQIDAEGVHGNNTQNGSDTTAADGSYNILLGPFSCFDVGGTGTVDVTVTSPNPQLAGQEANCPVSTDKCIALAG